MDREGRQPFFGSAKRNHSMMSEGQRDQGASSSSLFLPHDDHYDNEHAARRPRLALPPLRAAPARYAGDGLDFRRPFVSNVTSAAAPVIDLTDDDNTQSVDSQDTNADSAQATAGSSRASRLPRFGGRDIIDLAGSFGEGSAEEGEGRRANWLSADTVPARAQAQFAQLRRPARFNQPTPRVDIDDNELEIVSERTLSRPHTMSRQGSPAAPAQRSITPYPADRSLAPFVDLTEDDDVVLLSTRQREGRGVNAARPGTTAGVRTRNDGAYRDFGIGRIADMLQGGGRLMHRLGLAGLGDADEDFDPFADAAERHNQHHNHRHDRHVHRENGVNRGLFMGTVRANGLPGGMDYAPPAFDMGLPGGNRPPSPKYEPPASPGKGFTRNPGEDEVVVCPNCGDELAVSEDEVKQQVWVVKSCGHAYCGQCARNRSRKVSKKGKAKVTDTNLRIPFTKCVVEGCGKKVTASSLIHVFLGS